MEEQLRRRLDLLDEPWKQPHSSAGALNPAVMNVRPNKWTSSSRFFSGSRRERCVAQDTNLRGPRLLSRVIAGSGCSATTKLRISEIAWQARPFKARSKPKCNKRHHHHQRNFLSDPSHPNHCPAQPLAK